MNFAIFSTDGLMFFLRWLHLFFGVLWIGLLYYFNFVQGAFMAEADASTKSVATQKLVPRALWWFRWAALWTIITGFTYLSLRAQQIGPDFYRTSWGISILIGALLGLTMGFNVWFVIWPNQKKVIESASLVAQGKPALTEAAGCAARALTASRTNVLFSIPLLFYMAAASHLPFSVGENAYLTILWLVIAALVGGIEFNALKGKTGPLTTIRGVIHSAVALAIALYFIVELLVR